MSPDQAADTSPGSGAAADPASDPRSMAADLASSELFRGVPAEDLVELTATATARELAEDEVLIEQGARVEAVAVVRSGLLSVRRHADGQTREVARVGPGGNVGEMALLSDEPASATVLAILPTVVAELPHASLAGMLARPELHRRLQRTVGRREATNRLEGISEIAVTSPDGSEWHIRPLWPDDWRLMQASRKRISEESLRQRFFTLPKMHEGFLRRLANVDFLDQFAWAVLEDDGHGLVAVGRSARLPDAPDVAEIALLVADDLQGRGIGGLLTVALAAAAQAQGIALFEATALADNDAIQRLLTRYGAVWGPGERGQEVTARWPVQDVLDRAGHQHPVDALRNSAQAVLAE